MYINSTFVIMLQIRRTIRRGKQTFLFLSEFFFAGETNVTFCIVPSFARFLIKYTCVLAKQTDFLSIGFKASFEVREISESTRKFKFDNVNSITNYPTTIFQSPARSVKTCQLITVW